ncbi:MAG TPA: hypothetical protein VGK00_10645 [Anaerolineales bacterium]|jgi:hypothetical protein
MNTLRKIPVPLFLFLLSLLTYALFFWERGFYWDEAPWTWIYFRLGPAALTQTFSTSRPFWGLLYHLLLPVFGPHPWVWQILMVLHRWLTAVFLWILLRQVWTKDPRPALWASTLFLVYPGLGQNYISLMYTHFYVILNSFLLSLVLSIMAIRRKSAPLSLIALALAVVNLATVEYFYFLEFFRLLLFWFILDEPLRKRIYHTTRYYLPYFGAFVGVTLWRAFFFTNQNASYSYGTLQAIKENYFLGMWGLLVNMLTAFWESVPHAWLFPFEPVDVNSLGLYSTIAAFALALLATVLVGLYLRSKGSPEGESFTRPFLLFGLTAWVLGGGAFWLVGEKTLPQLHFSADRFNLSFMLGSSLIIAALIGLLHKYPRLQFGLLAVLIGFSVGKQFQINSLYRHDWDTQRNLFWQMSWRMPALEPGSTLLSNDLPVTLYSDNSLSGPLNWIYSPPGKMEHILYFASVRTEPGRALGTGLQPGMAFTQNYLATTFSGNTSKMVVFNFSPPGCLRVLDPEIDPQNKLLPSLLRDAARLSNPKMILTSPAASLPAFYNPEISRGWCYDFSQAELARQSGDWQKALDIRDQALQHGGRPNDPFENFVFIEAYAHTGQWQDALKLNREAYKFSKEVMRPTLCLLWNRIERDLPANPEKQSTLQAARADLACGG